MLPESTTRQENRIYKAAGHGGSEARVDAQPEHNGSVHVPELRTGGIEPPLERLINDLEVEGCVNQGVIAAL